MSKAFNEENKRTVIRQVRLGNYLTVAAALCGVDARTIHYWMKKGKDNPEGIYGIFYQKVQQAKAEWEAEALGLIVGSQDPKMMLEIMSRKSPDRWSASTRVTVQVKKHIEKFMDFLTASLEEEPELLERVLKIAVRYEELGEYDD
jgi:hypothetical protein